MTIREEEIHVLVTAWAISFSPNFANIRITTIGIPTTSSRTKAIVPLVSLLKPDERVSPAVASDVEIVQMGVDCGEAVHRAIWRGKNERNVVELLPSSHGRHN